MKSWAWIVLMTCGVTTGCVAEPAPDVFDGESEPGEEVAEVEVALTKRDVCMARCGIAFGRCISAAKTADDKIGCNTDVANCTEGCDTSYPAPQ